MWSELHWPFLVLRGNDYVELISSRDKLRISASFPQCDSMALEAYRSYTSWGAERLWMSNKRFVSKEFWIGICHERSRAKVNREEWISRGVYTLPLLLQD